jgi:hypothetical protein
MPLSGVKVTLASDRLAGPGRTVELTASTEGGAISVGYERKWGGYQNALDAWTDRNSRIEIETDVHLAKEGYAPSLVHFPPEAFPQAAGDIPLSLGNVLLKPLGQDEAAKGAE